MVDGPGVVTGRYGSTGVIYYIESDFWPHNTSLYVSDFCGNFPRFVFYLLQIMTFNAYNDKAAVPGIDRKDLHTIKVVCPSHDEQTAITKSLDCQMKSLEVLISKIGREIECLYEYRTRLIADVVTGKLDVTGVKIEQVDGETDFLEDFEENETEIDSDKEIDAKEGLDE
jgi:type I restriction enzyme S subunit